jgi:hypothetical protein
MQFLDGRRYSPKERRRHITYPFREPVRSLCPRKDDRTFSIEYIAPSKVETKSALPKAGPLAELQRGALMSGGKAVCVCHGVSLSLVADQVKARRSLLQSDAQGALSL